MVNEEDNICQSQKSLFRNHLQGMCPVTMTTTLPDPIKAIIVDAMRFMRGTLITGLPKQGTLRMWATRLINRFKYLPGNVLHIIFDNYGCDHIIHAKTEIKLTMKDASTSWIRSSLFQPNGKSF